MNPIAHAPIPERLTWLVVQADALYSSRPKHEKMQDLCCIVRGYVSLFHEYKVKNGQVFPWRRVHRKLLQMRRLALTPVDKRLN